jgi:hypothetical protein
MLGDERSFRTGSGKGPCDPGIVGGCFDLLGWGFCSGGWRLCEAVWRDKLVKVYWATLYASFFCFLSYVYWRCYVWSLWVEKFAEDCVYWAGVPSCYIYNLLVWTKLYGAIIWWISCSVSEDVFDGCNLISEPNFFTRREESWVRRLTDTMKGKILNQLYVNPSSSKISSHHLSFHLRETLSEPILPLSYHITNIVLWSTRRSALVSLPFW